jgi:hypothetical protein
MPHNVLRGDIFCLYIYGKDSKCERTKKALKESLTFLYFSKYYKIGHEPFEHNISVNIEFT